jgi:hypothetical protein
MYRIDHFSTSVLVAFLNHKKIKKIKKKRKYSPKLKTLNLDLFLKKKRKGAFLNHNKKTNLVNHKKNHVSHCRIIV